MSAIQSIVFWLLLCGACLALLEEQIVTFSPSKYAIAIHDATLIYDPSDPVGIEIATESLAKDWKQITGRSLDRYATNNSTGLDTRQTAIIVATVNSTLIRGMEQKKLLNVSDIRGKWETFRTTTVKNPLPGVKNALVIAGSDKRAVIYGVYTLSEQCGQSPYHFWADVPTTQHKAIYALPITTTHGAPSVKYRGIFINDEAPALTGWWSKKHGVDHYPLDSEFYRHVFDLILRLKGNFMWPAMWALDVPPPGNIFFTDDPYNQQLADDYGIVVSTSHHEPMQRATNEWNSSETGKWDWTENKENVVRFMEDGVRRAGRNETYFTLGMRGASDSPISGGDPIKILRDVFETQRGILAKHHKNASDVNQVWTIYKEVATYYAGGMIPPDDVTLMFTDDNWGNVIRLPTANETARSGGIGLYYHFEYVGQPKSYKWHNTNNLAKLYKELYQALEREVNRIWVFNVADIKPMELPLAFSMDMAWDASKFDFARIPEYLEAFSAREFGPDHTKEISSLLLQHSHLIGRRKYESTTSTTYSFYNHHEIERVVAEWEDLASRASKVYNALPPAKQAVFFHILQYPIQAGFLYHRIVLGQSTNQQFAIQRRNIANSIAQQILADSETDADLMDEYNSMLDGKWNGIMDQPKLNRASTSWSSPSRDFIQNLSFVQLRQNFVYVYGNLGIYAEESQSTVRQSSVCEACRDSWPAYLPTMDPYGPAVRTVDLFHRGDHRVPINWRLEVPYDWVKISPSSGNLTHNHPEQRLEVSIDWTILPSNHQENVTIGLHYDTLPKYDTFTIPVQNRPAPPDDFHGFPATNGYISIEAAHFQRASNETVHFEALPYLGSRTESGAIALRPYKAARSKDAQSAVVEYDIYLFNSTKSLNATLYFTQNLDTDPNTAMQYSLTIDSSEPSFKRILSQPATPGDLPDIWKAQVQDSVWRGEVGLGEVSAGLHTLKWRVNSPEVYLEKIILDTGRAVKVSYLGPPETTRL